jgi:hypothetical protein
MKEGFQNTVSECAALLSGGSEEEVATAMKILTLLHSGTTKAWPKPAKRPNT